MDVQKKKGSKRVDVQKKGRFRVQGVEAPLQMDTSVEALDDALVLVLGVVSAVTRSVTKDERKRAWGHAEAALQQPLVYKIETADVAGGFLAEWVEGMLGHRLYQHPDKIDDEAHCVKMVEHEQWTAVKEQAMRLEQQVRTARATPAALKHQLLAHGLVPVALQYGRNGAPKARALSLSVAFSLSRSGAARTAVGSRVVAPGRHDAPRQDADRAIRDQRPRADGV